MIDGDVITEARKKHGNVEMVEGERGGVSFKVAQIPLDVYMARRVISYPEYYAGNRLFKDWTASGQSQGVTANLNPVRGSGKGMSNSQMEARDRWIKAVMAINGTVARKMVVDVCCYGYSLKDASYGHYKNVNQAMARLHEAFDDLIAHYQDGKK
jgi:hypothetical protein